MFARGPEKGLVLAFEHGSPVPGIPAGVEIESAPEPALQVFVPIKAAHTLCPRAGVDGPPETHEQAFPLLRNESWMGEQVVENVGIQDFQALQIFLKVLVIVQSDLVGIPFELSAFR